MKKSLLSFALAVVTFSANASGNSGWLNLKSAKRGFSVQMPGIPTLESKMIHDQGASYMAYKYRLVHGDYTYSVLESDIGSTIPSSQMDQLLMNIIGGITEANRATVLKNDPVKFQGFPARVVVMEDANNWAWATLVCCDGKRSYIVGLKAPAAELNPEAIKEYFSTFKLLGS